MGRIRFLGQTVALLLSLLLGVGLILSVAGVLSLSSVGSYLGHTAGFVLGVAAGVGLLLVAVHYAVQIADDRLRAALFHHNGPGGRIDVTPAAIREFVTGVLQSSIGLDRFRVLLYHDGDGVRITVRTTLSPDQRVTELGERIQQELARHVADHTGVEVTSVTVLVRGIRRPDPGLAGTETDAD
jgi:uncharacterized alkaline shock family protein YloU